MMAGDQQLAHTLWQQEAVHLLPQQRIFGAGSGENDIKLKIDSAIREQGIRDGPVVRVHDRFRMQWLIAEPSTHYNGHIPIA
jgi:hypothetical protein